MDSCNATVSSSNFSVSGNFLIFMADSRAERLLISALKEFYRVGFAVILTLVNIN